MGVLLEDCYSQGQSSRAVLRWAVDSTLWQPRDEEWFFLLDLLPHEDQTQVRARPRFPPLWLAWKRVYVAVHSAILLMNA
jgi:hypothetical protein